MTRRRPARDVAQDRGDGEFWIDHAVVTEADLAWLGSARRLTLWNVRVPNGFLAALERLWWLDLRGGTATDLSTVRGCQRLRYLQLNQIRGLRDLGVLPTLISLELLSLYGLTRVESAPSLAPLDRLLRLEVGQLQRLPALAGLLDAPNLEELLLAKRVGVTDADVDQILGHSVQTFLWLTDGVSRKTSGPVLARVQLPATRSLAPADWFEQRADRAT